MNTREYLSELEPEEHPEDGDFLNPKIDHERCGCDYCMSEWKEWEEFKENNND